MIQRVFKWTCDFCGIVVEKESFGFPDGFRLTLPGVSGKPRSSHCCLDCRKDRGIDEGDLVELPK